MWRSVLLGPGQNGPRCYVAPRGVDRSSGGRASRSRADCGGLSSLERRRSQSARGVCDQRVGLSGHPAWHCVQSAGYVLRQAVRSWSFSHDPSPTTVEAPDPVAPVGTMSNGHVQRTRSIFAIVTTRLGGAGRHLLRKTSSVRWGRVTSARGVIQLPSGVQVCKDGRELRFTSAEWTAFRAGVNDGECVPVGV